MKEYFKFCYMLELRVFKSYLNTPWQGSRLLEEEVTKNSKVGILVCQKYSLRSNQCYFSGILLVFRALLQCGKELQEGMQAGKKAHCPF